MGELDSEEEGGLELADSRTELPEEDETSTPWRPSETSPEDSRENLVNDFLSAHYSSATGFLYSKSPIHLMQLAKFDREIYMSLIAYMDDLKERQEIIQG